MSEDYLARLKMQIQKTPSTDTDKTAKSPPSVGFVSVSVGHVCEIDDQPAVVNKQECGHPAPRITASPPFGSDGVPPRYAQAWAALLAQCPAGVDWSAAIFDAALLLGDWGGELARLHWSAGDILDAPREDRLGGLAWWIKGDPVVAMTLRINATHRHSDRGLGAGAPVLSVARRSRRGAPDRRTAHG
jgi:hypothetical protein